MGKKRRSKKNNQERQGHCPDENPRNTTRDSDAADLISNLQDEFLPQIIPLFLHNWMHQEKEHEIIRTNTANNMDPNDFISRLPNNILYHIIALLPFESAVQTTFLSTQWKDLWKDALLALVCDATMEDAMSAILNFLDNFALHHWPRNNWGFKFEFGHGRVLVAAVAPNNSLQLDFSAGKQELPRPFDWLLKLNLALPPHWSYRYIFDWMLQEPSFNTKKLKTLYLISVSYASNEAVSSMVSNLPFLESLTIAKCNGLRSLQIKKAGELSKLVVLDCPQLESLSFEGSKLTSFHYRGRLVSFEFEASSDVPAGWYFLSPSPNIFLLDDAMLDFRQGPLTEWKWDFGKPCLYPFYDGLYESNCGCATRFKCFRSILNSIDGVNSLTLCRWFFEKSICKKFPSSSRDLDFCFNQLQELWWIDCSMERENINALLFFLKLCSNLERLYVTIDPKCYNLPSTGKFSAVVSGPDKLNDLKFVKLEGCADEKMEIFFARRLIPLFVGSPLIISKPNGTCLRQLVKVFKREKKGKYPYKFKVVENLHEVCPDHVHMKL